VHVTVEVVILHGKACYVIVADIIQNLMCFDDCNSFSVRNELLIRMTLVGLPRLVRVRGIEAGITEAVKPETWRSSWDIAIQQAD
jgi:hypothetical protein